MLLDAVLNRFVERTPLAVAARGALEYALHPDHLDALFDQTAGRRVDRVLLFSAGADRMAAVVCRIKPSVHAANRAANRPVTVTEVYARLTGSARAPGGHSSGIRPTGWGRSSGPWAGPGRIPSRGIG
ncbi:MAG: Transposase domain protein [Gemmataceae bacterium]|nr:Transposase domain protein [Gemmataceae bacterium]